jgi:putative transposase
MSDELKQFLDDQIRTIAESKEWVIIELEVMSEHIHVFISPADIVKVLKRVTSKRVFEKFPKSRKKKFWGNHLWSPSYYVGTHGQVSAETIKKYMGGTSNRRLNSSTV